MLAVSRFVLRHKLAVAVFWLVVLAAGGAASAKLSGRLSAQFALPGAPSYQASQQILRIYGNGGPGYPEVAVVTLPPGQVIRQRRRTAGAGPGVRRGRPDAWPPGRRLRQHWRPGHSSPATRASPMAWCSPPTPGS